jgi:recombination protein RecT
MSMTQTTALTKGGGVRDYLARCKPALEQAIPSTLTKVMTPDRILRVMNSALTRVPALANCTPQSLALAMLGAVQLGLEPAGPLGHAYLIPYGSEVQLIIGYRGLLELARRSGQIKSITANVVHAGDRFECSFGLEPVLKHEPVWKGDPGPMIAAYCIVQLTDGGEQLEIMTRAQIDGIRARSRAGNKGPWVTDYDEMARKTVIRRALKYAPISTELADAIARDADSAADEPEARTLTDVVEVSLPDNSQAQPTPALGASLPPAPSRTDALKAQLTSRAKRISIERADGSDWSDAAPEEPPLPAEYEPGADG